MLYPGERGTPTVDGDRVYAFSSVGRIACLDVATGNEIWARDLRVDYRVTALPRWGFSESPFVDDDKVILWIGGNRASVVALDKMTGKTVWTTPSTGQTGAYATAVAFDFADQRTLANMNATGVLAVNAETGAILFDIPHPTDWNVQANTPYFFGERYLFVTSGYGTTGAAVYRLNVTTGANTPERVWHERRFDNKHHGFVVKDGYVYASTDSSGGQRWMCIRLADGEIMWEQRIRGIGRGNIAYADGMLYCICEREGVVALVRATPESFQEVSRFTLPEGVGSYWAHPAIINQKLFLRHGSVLYCFDIAER
jgi:outer membrane protein assembly factor BamB